MGYVFKAQWALNNAGIFQKDAWFLFEKEQVIKYGFGTPPQGFNVKILPEGVVIPAFVNSHTHLELSPFARNSPGSFENVHDFALSVMSRYKPDIDNSLEWAKELISIALKAGTTFFVDISNNPVFSEKLALLPQFNGIRFLELLGYSSPNDDRRIRESDNFPGKKEFFITPHSIYGSSPEIMRYVSVNNRKIISIHLLEEPAETGIFNETGKTWDFLIKIGQAVRHTDIFGNNLVDYLNSFFSAAEKLLFVHLLCNDQNLLKSLENKFPQSAMVICHRSNKTLGYHRQNGKILESMNIPLLLGTDSAASSPDISIINEVKGLIEDDIMSENHIWKAATFNAYNYFNIPIVPWFFYEGCKPDITEIQRITPRLLSVLK